MKRQWLGAAVVAGCVGGAGPVLAQEPADPLEPLNRAMFEWNLAAYDRVLVPAARYYRDATTAAEREAIGHFLTNLRAPVVAANQLLQGDGRAGITLRRFAINSTVGLFGLFDPATDWGYPTQMPEDFGQTLAAYGVPDGTLSRPAAGRPQHRARCARARRRLSGARHISRHGGAQPGAGRHGGERCRAPTRVARGRAHGKPRPPRGCALDLRAAAGRGDPQRRARRPTRATRASSRSSRQPGGGGKMRG